MEITSNLRMVAHTMDMDLEMNLKMIVSSMDWQGTMPPTIIIPIQSKIRVLPNMPDSQRGMKIVMIWLVTWLSISKNPKL